jgi:hypothetical protein
MDYVFLPFHVISCRFGIEVHGMQEVAGSIPAGSTIHPFTGFTGVQPTSAPSIHH